MKRTLHFLWNLSILLLLFSNFLFAGENPVNTISQSLNPAPVPLPPPVTSTIGPTGTFTSITAALANLQSVGTADPLIWELQSTYVSSVETFPIAFTATNLNGISATNTLTIRPEAGATGLVISAGTAQTVYLNGAHDVIFDGRPGGSGTTPQLIITNTSTTFGFYPFQFLNATRNVLQYCEITSSNASQLVSPWTGRGAAIYFTSGNSYNTIDNCSIHGIGNDAAGIANNLIYAANTSTYTTITNNNFYNFGTKGNVGAAAVYLAACTGSVISGNSFYQTAPRTVQYGTYAILTATGDNYIITGNYIGGTAPLCGGSPMILNQTYNYEFFGGLYITAGTTIASSIQGNTIQNIQINHTTNTSSSGTQAMITLLGGNINAGDITPNIIGSQSVPNSISFNQNYNGVGTVYGINITGTGAHNVTNNIICGITVTTTISQRGINFAAIGNTASNTVISGNIIGSTILADAISNSSYGVLYGIISTGGTATISGNTISNLTHSATALNSQQLFGIATSGLSGTVNNIINNTIQNLTSSSSSTTGGNTSSIVGISNTAGTTGGQTITNNVIKGLSNTDAAAAVNITGIYYQGPTAGTNVVSKNLIHSFSLASTATTAGLTGIYSSTGTTTFSNNMVRLGIDASGNGLNTGYAMNGIYDAAGTNSYYFNSIYLGGSGVTGTTSPTYAYNSAASGTTRNILDNIFVNARSGGSTGQHYAITIAGTTPLPTGVTCNNNILFAPGVIGGNIGFYNGAAQPGISDWRGVSGLDGQSGAADPAFVNPTGDISSIDLHVQNSNPIEAAGVLVPSVTDDFDGQTRSTLTPTDIGADAGNFTSSGDIFSPSISFTPLPNTASTANLTLTGFATITDNIGVSGGLNLPRIYYKKATDNNAFVGNTSADNGWKYTVSTSSSSPYSFIIDYSIINGGSVTPGDAILYFVVAQDDANNLTSKAGGATASSPTDPVQNINGAPLSANLNSYLIINNNINGTITIPGNYPNLTGTGGLFSAINLGTVTGNMNVLISGNLSEDGTYALNQWVENPPASNFTLTIGPADASLKTISGSLNNGLIRLNGADRVTIDGRYGGSGTWLEFENTNSGTSSATFTFLADATGNTIKYAGIKGANPSATAGVVVFSTATATGNDNNTLDYCDIHDGSGLPANLVYSAGTTTTVTHYNSGIMISNCNIYNWNSTTANSFGISLITGNTDWTMTGNSFYQTAARVLGNFTTGAISVANTTNGNNFSVINNYVGGDSPNANVTTIPMTFTGTGLFQGIGLNVATLTASSVQGNTVRNISLSTGSVLATHAAIVLGAGAINCGNVTPNTVGSDAAAGSIAVINTGTSTAQVFSGILAGTGTPGAMVISNNVISGIAVSGSSTGTTGLRGISFQGSGGPYTVSGNTIGSLTLANALSNSTAQALTGIYQASSTGAVTIQGNTISNLSQSNTGAATNQLYGIYKAGVASTTISGNTVSNLVSSSTLTGAGSASALIGINCVTATTSLLTQNTIHSLSSVAPSAAVNIAGIYATGTTVISRNFVHSFSLSSTATAAGMTGIYAGGSSAYQNNMVRLGIDAAGADINTGYSINGIYDGAGNNNFYFNSVYIGGSAVSGTTSATYALNSITVGTRIFQDNIFVNARSGGTIGAGINHYAVKMAGTIVNPAGLTSGYNLLYAPGLTGGMIGYYNGADLATLGAWQGATGQDLTSGMGDPNFVNPTGTVSTADLHVQASTPIEAAGFLIASVTDDYDGSARGSLTPTDIGADAGTFTSSADVFSPVISFTALANTALLGNRTLTGFAAITDNVGVSAGSNLPRIYYKRSTEANAFVGNTSADDGWKFTVATNATSPYDFVIDYSILLGGNAAAGNIIQYFVVAQDDANNLASKVAGAGASANPPVQNINSAPASSINSYTILSSISGTFTVGGAGANYTTLTAADGAFAAINASNGASAKVTGNIVIVMTGNTTEPGTVALNQWTEEPAGSNFTVTIQPDAAAMRTATGSLATPLFRLDGADRVTIDGRFGGSGRYLTFSNTFVTTGATSATLNLLNGATYNTIESCIIQGGEISTTSGVVFFGTTTNTTGNSNNTINQCQIMDVGGTTRTANMIASSGHASYRNLANIISNNEISNFENSGVKLALNSNDWVITGNSFFYNKATTSIASMRVFELSSANTLVSGNYIGGQAPLCGGSAFISGPFTAFYNSNTGTANSYQGNTIQNITINGGASQVKIFYGYQGPVNIGNVTGNLFGHPSNPGSIVINTTSGYNHVIYFQTTAANVMNNTMANIVFNPVTGPNNAVIEMNYGGPNVIKDNVIHDIYSSSAAGTTDATAALTGINAPMYAGVTTIENNTIYNLSTTNVASTAAITVQGIYLYGGSGNVFRNYVYNLTTANTGGNANIYGIHISGTYTIYNNLVALGNGQGGPANITGLFNDGGSSNCYFNSVNITGSAVSGSNASNAYFRSSTAATTTLKNNILSNSRTGGSGIHSSIRVNPSGGTFNSDYNDLYTSGATLGFWGAAAQANLSAWKLASSKDASSVSVDPQFVSATDLHTLKPELNNSGIAITGITVDYANVTRTNPPDIGAYEFNLVISSINTLAATTIDKTTATINGNINTSNEPVAMSFEYGLTDSYGSSQAAVPATVQSVTSVPVAASLTSLSPNTLYHYRVKGVVTSPALTVYGLDMTFVTLPDPSLAGPTSVCALSTGNVYTTDAGHPNYAWTVSAGGTITAGGTNTDNTVTVTWDLGGAQSVSVNYDNSAGFPALSPTVYNVTVLPAPTAVISGGTAICEGAATTLSIDLTGAQPWIVTYTDGLTPVTVNNISVSPYTFDVSPLTTTTYTITSVSDANACVNPQTSSATVIVNTNLPVSVLISADAGAVCPGTMVNFTATPTNGGTPFYQWYVNALQVGTDNPSYSYAPADADQVYVVMTSSEVCQTGSPATSNIVTMTVRAPLSGPVASADQVLCFGNAAATLTATSATGGSGPYNYQWQSSPDGITAWTDIPAETTLSYSPGTLFATSYYRVTATDAGTPSCGSVNSNTVTVTVNNPLDHSVIGNPQTVCNGDIPQALTATPTTGGTGPFSYQWQKKETTTWVNVGTNSLTYQPPALTVTTDYRLIASDTGVPSCGSVLSNVIPITVQSVPLAGTIGADQTLCQGNPASPLTSLTDGSGAGIITYEWEYSTDGGLNWVNIPGETGAGYAPGTLTQTTMYHRLTVSTLNAVACKSAATAAVTVYINTYSANTIGTAQSICSGSTAALSGSLVTGSGSVTYQWQSSSSETGPYGNVATGGTAQDYTTDALVSDTWFRRVATSTLNAVDCITNSNSILVSVVTELPVSVSVSADANPVCAGTTVNFTAVPVNGGTPAYQWYVNSQPAGTSSAAYSYIPANGDQVYVVMTSSETCTTGNPATSNTVTMVVDAILTSSVTIQADANPVCEGTTVNFTATPVNGGATPAYQWYNGAVAVGTNSPSYSYIPVNGDVISVTMTPALPCISGNPVSNAITMTVNAYLATAEFSANNLTPQQNTDVLFTDQSTGTPTSWDWSFNPATVTYTGGTNATSQNPQVQFNASGSYSVTLTVNGTSCPNSLTKIAYIFVGVPGLWTGNTSADWNTASNWDDFTIPAIPTDVVIPASAPNWPTYTGSVIVGTTCKSITLLGPASQLTITGNLTILDGYTVENPGNIIVQGL